MAALPLRVGLYGQNGHQIQHLFQDNPYAQLSAVAGFKPETVAEIQKPHPDVAISDSLTDLLRDDRLDLISLCSPRRADQARDAIACLQAGKHVYAEKPCALHETDLDEILATAKQAGREFHEMAGTIFTQPYYAMRDIVRSGRLGTIVQVLVQKSYPYHAQRPQDEAVDGGLIAQVGIHGTRLIEQLSGTRLVQCVGFRTGLGNPQPGGLQMAASLSFSLENGGCATLLANYFNQWSSYVWGYEEVRLFGTLGMLESTEGGKRTRLIIDNHDLGPIDASESVDDYFVLVAKHLLDLGAPVLTLDEEFHPTRMILRARQAAIHVAAS